MEGMKEPVLTRRESQEIADRLLAREGLPPVTVVWGEVKRGQARYGTGRITMPEWATRQGRPFALAYLLHEIAHFIAKGDGHGRRFREEEERLLAEHGMTLERVPGGVYVRTLFRLDDLAVLWREGEERKREATFAAGMDQKLQDLLGDEEGQ